MEFFVQMGVGLGRAIGLALTICASPAFSSPSWVSVLTSCTQSWTSPDEIYENLVSQGWETLPESHYARAAKTTLHFEGLARALPVITDDMIYFVSGEILLDESLVLGAEGPLDNSFVRRIYLWDGQDIPTYVNMFFMPNTQITECTLARPTYEYSQYVFDQVDEYAATAQASSPFRTFNTGIGRGVQLSLQGRSVENVEWQSQVLGSAFDPEQVEQLFGRTDVAGTVLVIRTRPLEQE